MIISIDAAMFHYIVSPAFVYPATSYIPCFEPFAQSQNHPYLVESKMTSAIIIGAGPSGIAMAYKLKRELGFNEFTVGNTSPTIDRTQVLMNRKVYEKLDGAGGTWRTNVYPGW